MQSVNHGAHCNVVTHSVWAELDGALSEKSVPYFTNTQNHSFSDRSLRGKLQIMNAKVVSNFVT